MPDYSKLHQMMSHRISFEYDTGARISGYLAGCQPSDGQVEFVKLTSVKLIDSDGDVLETLDELYLCPNVVTNFNLEEGPSGREVV